MEHYSKKAGLKVCCHQLRHTMATQLLNADADVSVIAILDWFSVVETDRKTVDFRNYDTQTQSGV